jgi:hypothetical protein
MTANQALRNGNTRRSHVQPAVELGKYSPKTALLTVTSRLRVPVGSYIAFLRR